MIVGYAIENVLGFVLTFTLFLLRRKAKNLKPANAKFLDRCIHVATQGCSSFYDCAVFFTFSIQLACTVVLARLDFGINTTGVGDSTAKITWAISLLTMLPLLYISFNPGLLREPSAGIITTAQNQGNKDHKEQLRFLLFALCWLLFIHPFLSRMMETFGRSSIGGSSQVISTSDWSIIETSCLANVHTVTNKDIVAMNVFSVSGSLFVCVLALAKIFWLAVQRRNPDSRLIRYIRQRWLETRIQKFQLSIVFFVAIPVFAISQWWTILRWRAFQTQVSTAAGNLDSDGQWTFEQIAAITIFVPVLVKCSSAWLYE